MPIGRSCLSTQATFTFPDAVTIDLPSVTSVEPPDVFTNESTCLLERVIRLNAGYPTHCIFMKKSHVETGKDGWNCHYSGVFRPFILPVVEDLAGHKQLGRSKAKTGVSANTVTTIVEGEIDLSDSSSYCSTARPPSDYDGVSIYNSDDDRPDDLAFWFSDDDEDVPKKKTGTKAAPDTPMADRPRLLSAQHDSVLSILSPLIDAQRYTLIVNTLDAIVTVRWKLIEQTPELWSKFSKAKKAIDSRNRKKLVASCSSSLTLYTVENIRRRVERWCAWHSAWVYDTRPTSWYCGCFVNGIHFPTGENPVAITK